ncbi:MAG: DUF1289 domain-containing protein [Sneathiella sp.]|nr:DUF1289 domain-containing protein [Sneathiella sp.]
MHRKVLQNKPSQAIASPCTGVCTMDMKNQYCLGCYRSRLEIGGWIHLKDTEKLTIVRDLRKRRKESSGK